MGFMGTHFTPKMNYFEFSKTRKTTFTCGKVYISDSYSRSTFLEIFAIV